MCCVFSSLEETISYPPLVLLKGLEDKKLIKFYLLILITFTSHMESWLFFLISIQHSHLSTQGREIDSSSILAPLYHYFQFLL